MSSFKYASVLCLSVQSYRSSQSMTTHIVRMARDMTKSETLESKAGADHSMAAKYAESSKADHVEAELLQESALELETESARETALAEANLVSEEEYNTKAAGEQLEADALGAEAAADEGVYLEESEKAVAEAAAAAKDMAETGSDTAGVAICEFIPLVDIVCDVVGTIAALGLQSQAAKLTAQSALDVTAATTAKLEEEALLTHVEAVEEVVLKDKGIATAFAADAEAEEALAAEETAEAEKDEAEALELFEKSKEEELLAEEEAAKAQEEEMEVERESGKAILHGLEAFKDAVVSGVFSFVAMAFFCVRLLVAILIPGGTAIVGFIPYTMTMQESGRAVASCSEWGRNAIVAIPKREISYFAGHCGVFLLSMTVLGPQFSLLDKIQIRNQGGVILCFAGIAALTQSLLLHLLPLAVSMCNAKEGRPGAMQVLRSIVSTISLGVIYLVPLFILELCELRLLSSDFFFATDFSRLVIICLCGSLLILGVLFAITLEENNESNNKANDFRDSVDTDDLKPSETSKLLQNGHNEYSGVDIEVSAQKEIVVVQQEKSGVQQYISDLKLPFEILVATCMFVMLRQCSPVVSQLFPRIMKTHPHFIAECIGGSLLVSLVLWCLHSTNNSQYGHVGIWTGRIVGSRKSPYV